MSDWIALAASALAALQADWGEPIPDDHEIGRIDGSRGSPSFRIRAGHIRQLSRISTPASAATGGGDFPAGAIENGRVLFDRVEQQYDFECEAGPLANCTDWHELRRCFEHLADWAALAAPPPPAQAADGWRPAPADIYVVLRSWAERYHQDGQSRPDWLAAAAREVAALHPIPPAPEAGS